MCPSEFCVGLCHNAPQGRADHTRVADGSSKRATAQPVRCTGGAGASWDLCKAGGAGELTSFLGLNCSRRVRGFLLPCECLPVQSSRVRRRYKRRLDLRLAPDTPDVLRMLLELKRKYHSLLPLVLGCPARTVYCWLAGSACPTLPATRAIWLTWALLLHPERCQTVADLITWGRFQIRPPNGEQDKRDC